MKTHQLKRGIQLTKREKMTVIFFCPCDSVASAFELSSSFFSFEKNVVFSLLLALVPLLNQPFS